MNHPPRNAVWTAMVVVVVLFLPMGYMGAYYGMLKDQISLASPPAFGTPFNLMLEPVYRLESPIVEKTLRPAHRFDRWIRPDFWGE